MPVSQPLIPRCCCSRTIRRIYWALLGALATWWLLMYLQTLDIDRYEGLWVVFVAVLVASWAEDTVQKHRHLRPFSSKQVNGIKGDQAQPAPAPACIPRHMH